MTAPEQAFSTLAAEWPGGAQTPRAVADHLVRGADMAQRTAEERFWSKVVKTKTCWLWIAGKRQGYGQFHADGRTQRAHRWSYEHFVGPIPPGLHLDHLCRKPSCVNPAHLEPVTPRENALRGEGFGAINAAKTQCKQGHDLTPDNVYVYPNGLWRECRKCRRRYDAQMRQRWRERGRKKPSDRSRRRHLCTACPAFRSTKGVALLSEDESASAALCGWCSRVGGTT